MSYADTINQKAETSGGEWVKLRNDGEAIVGELIDIIERLKTYEGAPVLSRKGNPRMEWVITLRVDSTGAVDDGLRKLPAPEGLQWAILDHLKAADVRFPSTWGGRLAIGVKKGAPTATSQVEEWSVRYTPPSTADAINAAVDAQPATTPAADPLDGLV